MRYGVRLISDFVHINDPVTGQRNFRVRSGNLVRSGVVECELNIRVGWRSMDPHCNMIINLKISQPIRKILNADIVIQKINSRLLTLEFSLHARKHGE